MSKTIGLILLAGLVAVTGCLPAPAEAMSQVPRYGATTYRFVRPYAPRVYRAAKSVGSQVLINVGSSYLYDRATRRVSPTVHVSPTMRVSPTRVYRYR